MERKLERERKRKYRAKKKNKKRDEDEKDRKKYSETIRKGNYRARKRLEQYPVDSEESSDWIEECEACGAPFEPTSLLKHVTKSLKCKEKYGSKLEDLKEQNKIRLQV